MIARTTTTTALLVDDDDASLEANRQRLQDGGYTVILARDSAEGLSRARQSLPAVIFIHLVAHAGDNVALIQALRADDSCRHTSVTVLGAAEESRPGPKPLRRVHRDNW